MDYVSVNIVDYDENSHVMHVNFSDGNNVTPTYAFYPHLYSANNSSDIIKQIAMVGRNILSGIEQKNVYAANTDLVAAIKNTVGAHQTFQASDLINANNFTLEVSL